MMWIWSNEDQVAVHTVFMCESLYQEQKWEKTADMIFRPFSKENLWSVDMTFNNSEHLYPICTSEVSPHTCMIKNSGDFDNWDPLYFRRCTLQDHMHDAPLSLMISIYHSLQWSLWPWSLTVSYRNCKCLHHLLSCAISVYTKMCGLYLSQQLTVWCCVES